MGQPNNLDSILSLGSRQQDFVRCLLSDNEVPNALLGEFSVYRNNRSETLIKALKNIFPVCERLLGEACFRGLAHYYCRDPRSARFSLEDWGDQFSNFIKTFKPLESLSYLCYVAEFEWRIQKILFGPEDPFFSWESLKNIQPNEMPKVVFQMPRSSDLFYAPFPIDTLWEVNQANFLGEPTVELGAGEVFLFLCRKNLDFYFSRISKPEWALLNQLKSNKALQHFTVMISPEEDVLLINQCIQKGYIQSFTIQN